MLNGTHKLFQNFHGIFAAATTWGIDYDTNERQLGADSEDRSLTRYSGKIVLLSLLGRESSQLCPGRWSEGRGERV